MVATATFLEESEKKLVQIDHIHVKKKIMKIGPVDAAIPLLD